MNLHNPLADGPQTPSDSKVQGVITTLMRAGFLEYTYIEEFDLSLIQPLNKVQVRDSGNYAPPDKVKEMAQILDSDPMQLPPVVLTADYFLVDGNTRKKANEKAGRKTFHALVIGERHEGSSESFKNRLNILAGLLNLQTGTPLNEGEKRRVALNMIAENWSTASIQAASGLSQAAINNLRKEGEVRARLGALGITPPKKVKLTNFGSQAVLALNDEPFRKFFDLANEAGLNSSEVSKLAKEVGAVGKSEEKQVKAIAERRMQDAQRIADHKTTGNGQPPKSSFIRRTLGQLIAVEGQEADCIDKATDPAARKTYIDRLKRAQEVLAKIVRHQGNFDARA